MALPTRYGINKNINSMEGLGAYENGGKGSGNFGHSGRPGEKMKSKKVKISEHPMAGSEVTYTEVKDK